MTVTVLLQLLTPRLTTAIGYRWVLAIGSSLLGLPSGLLAVFDGPFAVLAISGVRGAGFGMMTVAGSALVAELAPPGMLGRATSLIGLAVGISEALFLPLGLWVLDVFGLPAAAGSATAFGVGGLVAAARLPDVYPEPPERSDPAALSRKSVMVLLAGPFLVMLAVTLPYGAAASFLSPALDSSASGGGAVGARGGLGARGGGVCGGTASAPAAWSGPPSASPPWAWPRPPRCSSWSRPRGGSSSPPWSSASGSAPSRTRRWSVRSSGCRARAWAPRRRRGTSHSTPGPASGRSSWAGWPPRATYRCSPWPRSSCSRWAAPPRCGPAAPAPNAIWPRRGRTIGSGHDTTGTAGRDPGLRVGQPPFGAARARARRGAGRAHRRPEVGHAGGVARRARG